MSLLELRKGARIRHNKRGTDYEVVGYSQWASFDLKDGRTITRYLANESGLPMQVHVQVSSASLPPGSVAVVYYRALASQPGKPWLFVRPLTEFTASRFTLIEDPA